MTTQANLTDSFADFLDLHLETTKPTKPVMNIDLKGMTLSQLRVLILDAEAEIKTRQDGVLLEELEDIVEETLSLTQLNKQRSQALAQALEKELS